MSKKVAVKIRKDGFSKSIGSGFGFGSWTIGATSLEVEVELDLETDEGKADYKKISDTLSKACMNALERDVAMAREASPELDASIKKRETAVKIALENEAKHG